MACPVCHNLSTSIPNNGIFSRQDSGRGFPITPADLRRRAEQGCVSCDFLLRGILEFVSEHEVTDIYASSMRISETRSRFVISAVKADGSNTRLVFYPSDEKLTKLWPMLPVASHLSEDSSSPECLNLARKWLNQCLQSHDRLQCKRLTETELPTRVISVGNADTAPRLYEPHPGTKAKYVALSYCWGSGRTFLNTQATYQRLKQGFTLEEMPKTCRDAVLITRNLGIPYIWIDQLCIIQDSSEDWNREAQRMCAVYENASVTLAGLDSPSSDVGLFLASRDRRTVALDVNLPGGSTVSIYVRKEYRMGSQGFIHCVQDFPKDTKGDVLVTRGWTLQEVTLSPRIIWFTASEMAWSCLSCTSCECDPVLTSEWNEGSAKGTMLVRQQISSSSDDMSLWMSIWKELVQSFSQRNLTKQVDRLPALAGLAAAFQRKVKDQYLAGLWRTQLATQLIWGSYPEEDFIEGNQGIDPKDLVPDRYGPSWSWCSVSGVVNFLSTIENRKYETSWKILDAQYYLSGFGPTPGTLTIEGFLLPIHYSNRELQASNRATFSPIDNFIPDKRPAFTGLNSLTARKLYYLHAGKLQNLKKSGVIDICVGIILEPSSSNHTNSTFKRIGLIESQFKSSDSTGDWASWQSRCQKTTVHII